MFVLGECVKEVTVHKKKIHVDGVKCDICGKIITPSPVRSLRNQYYKVTTGHNDWGNDSYESVECKDMCRDCVPSFVAEYVKKSNGTEYLEMELNHLWMNEYYYEESGED